MNLCELTLYFINFPTSLNENLWIYWWFIVSCLQKIHFVPKDHCKNHQIQFLLKYTTIFSLTLVKLVLVLNLLKCKIYYCFPPFKKKKITEDFTSIFEMWWDSQNLKLQGQMYFPEWLSYCSVWWQERNKDAWALRLLRLHYITRTY